MTLALLFLLFSSCKKQVESTNPEISYRVNTLSEVKVNLMTRIIAIAKNSPEFKTAVENECLKQVRGDYNGALERLLEIDRQTSIIPAREKNAFVSLVNQMKEFRPGKMPILFVPVMEKRDSKLRHNINATDGSAESAIITAKQASVQNPVNPNNYITMVDQENRISRATLAGESEGTSLQKKTNFVQDPGDGDPTACTAPYYYPGYIIDNYGNLTYSICINEDYAWNHDVWVLGYEEDVSPDNQVASLDDLGAWTMTNSRSEGAQEYGGRIQITDLGALEPWVRGKPEFKYFIYTSTGVLVKERAFGKWRRSNFSNGQWVYFKDFIGTWNTASWGNTSYERWIEEDGGTSAALTQVISYVVNGITYTTTISTPAKNGDDDMGYANIQFADDTYNLITNPQSATMYTFNYMNMYRSHSPY